VLIQDLFVIVRVPRAGYVSGVWYKMMGGTQWVSNVLLVSVLFCGPLLGVFSVLNTIAWVQGSTQALPFGTICIIIVIWALVTFPLTVLGGIAGKNSREEFAAPCRCGLSVAVCSMVVTGCWSHEDWDGFGSSWWALGVSNHTPEF
jgi:hypothetical protein